jgi:hypothetical protein
VKDLPQEVKDGLEIIYVRYINPPHMPIVTKYHAGTSGKQCATYGQKHTGPAKRTSQASRVACRLVQSIKKCTTTEFQYTYHIIRLPLHLSYPCLLIIYLRSSYSLDPSSIPVSFPLCPNILQPHPKKKKKKQNCTTIAIR